MCVYVCVCVCPTKLLSQNLIFFELARMYTHVSIYVYMYIYVYTYIYTYVHTFIYKFMRNMYMAILTIAIGIVQL